MQSTIFDTEWAVAVTGDMLGLIERLSPHVREVDHVDESLQDEIRQITIRQRTLSWALSSHRLRDSLGDHIKAVAGVWIISQIILDTARLINYDLQGRPMGCVALAMICSLLSHAGDSQFGQKRVFASLPAVFIRLQTEMLQLDGRLGNHDADLYCLYVGARLEQQQSIPHASNLWFNQAFAKKAEEIGLTTWDHVRERLIGFLYLPQIKPPGETWVEDTLSTRQAPEVNQTAALTLAP